MKRFLALLALLTCFTVPAVAQFNTTIRGCDRAGFCIAQATSVGSCADSIAFLASDTGDDTHYYIFPQFVDGNFYSRLRTYMTAVGVP